MKSALSTHMTLAWPLAPRHSQNMRLVLMVGVALAIGCTSGGQTGEIAMMSCETPLGLVDHSTVAAEVGASANEWIATLAPAAAPLTWQGGATSEIDFTFESAEGYADGVQVLDGDSCDPYLRAPTWVSARTTDGRLDERVLADVDLRAPSTAIIRVDVYIDSLAGTFDPSAFATVGEASSARLFLQVQIDGTSSTGTLMMHPGGDGQDLVAVGAW